MTLADVETYMQRKVVKELPSVLGKAELASLTFLDGAPDTESQQWSMGIYLSSPDGMVYEQDEKALKAFLTFDGNLSRDREDASLSAKYASVVMDWIRISNFDFVSITPTLAVTQRVDLDDRRNGFAILLEIVFDYLRDGYLIDAIN